MDYSEALTQRSSEALTDDSSDYKAFMLAETDLIRQEHEAGEGGLKIAGYRSALLDTLIAAIFKNISTGLGITPEKQEIAVLALGGYGRGHLNPSSDIDILFLLPNASKSLSKINTELTQGVLYKLWDLGLKLGHSTRSISECIAEAKADQQSKTALMDARFITGDDSKLQVFYDKFEKDCITKGTEDFFNVRRADIKSRHKKYSFTVFLQEPHVKESCGGLRDFQNVMWLTRVKKGYTDLTSLIDDKILTKKAYKAMGDAYDFLHRVRNELHFHTGSSTDILTLQLQGVVATNFQYPQKSILRRCETFMRDYYRHTKALHQHATSLMEIFQIEIEDKKENQWHSFLTNKRKKREEFECFIAKNGRIYPKNSAIFTEQPHQMMAVFRHCQQRNLRISPQMRKLLKNNLNLVDRSFRNNKQIREIFQAILESKGLVARSMRRMHRVGFLGAYLPEFGAMDCLVQHEFFHRYTADEHTLRCIDKLDELVTTNEQNKERYKTLLNDIGDPYALYIALLLHDSGRAENVREHTDGSAMLASKVCSRLKIAGNRRVRIMFLVDHHLTFWRYATTRNLEDTEVIEEFASQMKDTSLLSALFLFTYADSNGTNDEAWSPWKETLMIQLYQKTLSFMNDGKERYEEHFKEQKSELLERITKNLDEKYHDEIKIHFDSMPARYFKFQVANTIAAHIKSAHQFRQNEKDESKNGLANMKWTDYKERGYTDLTVICRSRPLLLERVCCALASQEITIISADVFTRKDNIVCDIFRVSTLDWEAIQSKSKKQKVLETFTAILQQDDYGPEKYLTKKKNLLRKDTSDSGIPFPVRAYISNEMSDTYTVLNIQGLDRIGLLHDLFRTIAKLGLATVNARICTEKGAALNTIYMSYPGGGKIVNPEELENIESEINAIIS